MTESQNAESMSNFFQKEKFTIDALIASYFESKEFCKTLYGSAMEYSLLPEGKRYRSIVSLEIYRLLGGEDSDLSEAVVALECLHHASLIYDDLPAMDDSVMRKNKDSVHVKYGENIALLAAAGLQEEFRFLLNTTVYKHIAYGCNPSDVNTYVYNIISKLLKGQEVDFNVTKTDEDLEVGMRDKNSLFTLSVVLPVLLLGKSESVKQFHFLGERLAHLYQLFDDLRDLETEEVTGKKGEVDIKKNTILYRKGEKKVRELIHASLAEVNLVLDQIEGSNKLKNIIKFIFTKPS